jgi:hypothetical protein
VLIRAGDEIFGQIDLDARSKDAFTREDQEAVELVADKLAEVFMAERRYGRRRRAAGRPVDRPPETEGPACTGSRAPSWRRTLRP